MWKYGTQLLETNYSISFHRESRHLVGAILLATRGSRQQNPIEIGNRNTNNIKMVVEVPIYAGKICDMRTLLKYAKNATVAYSHETDMPIWCEC